MHGVVTAPMPLPLGESIAFCLCVIQLCHLPQKQAFAMASCMRCHQETTQPFRIQVQQILFSVTFVSYSHVAYNKPGIYDGQLHLLSPRWHTAFLYTISADTVQCDLCVALSAESTHNAKSAACSKASWFGRPQGELHNGFQLLLSCALSHWYLQFAAAMLSTHGDVLVGGALCGPER